MNNTYKNWIVTITQVIDDPKNKGAKIVDVSIESNGETKERNFEGVISKTHLASLIRRWIDSLTESASIDTEIDMTLGDNTQGQDEIDRQLWLKRNAIWGDILQAIERGYVSDTDPDVVQLKAWLDNKFKKSYLIE